MWDEEAQRVSLRLRLKTATALFAVSMLAATPVHAQVVVGRATGGPDVQVAAPARTQLPPEWLRHIPKATGSMPYQPKRVVRPPVAAPNIGSNYSGLPITPSARPMAAPRIQTQPGYVPPKPAAQKDAGLMAAPWSPRSQHVDQPLFPELQPQAQQDIAGQRHNNAVLAAPRLGGAKPVVTRNETTLPPVLTPDLMDSLQMAGRNPDYVAPPVAHYGPGNGINASSAQDRTQSLGTIERSLVDEVIAEREARELGRPYVPGTARRRYAAADEPIPLADPMAERESLAAQFDAPAPYDERPREIPRDVPRDVPLPPAPLPTPTPSTMGYMTPPRSSDDDVTVPSKQTIDSLQPLDGAPVPSNARVLGRASDTQKPTVYNAPMPIPMDNVASAPAPDAAMTKGEARKLFSAKKGNKQGDKKKAAAAPAPQMDLFDTPAQPEKIVPLPAPDASPETVAAATGPRTILALGPDGVESEADLTPAKPQVKAAADVAEPVAEEEIKITVDSDAREVKQVPVNQTPFGDNVVGSIGPNGTEAAASDIAPDVTDSTGAPDITTATSAPPVLRPGTKITRANPNVAVPTTAADAMPAPVGAGVGETASDTADRVEIPARVETPRVEKTDVEKVAPPADDEIRVVVEDEPVTAAKPAPRPVPSSAPSLAPALEKPAPVPVEEYTPPRQALRREYRDNPDQVLKAPSSATNSAPTDLRSPPPRTPSYTSPFKGAPQEQLYVRTPATTAGERPRLRTPKLLAQSDLPAASASANTVATITPDNDPAGVVVPAPVQQQAYVPAPTVIERPELVPPPEAEIDPVVIAPPAADIQLRMPAITFGPTERELDSQGEAQVDILASQLGENPGRRVTLMAYAQAPNLNEARRVALSRALAIRSRLAEHGIQPLRVSIKALGTLPPGDRNSPDRVDTIVQ